MKNIYLIFLFSSLLYACNSSEKSSKNGVKDTIALDTNRSETKKSRKQSADDELLESEEFIVNKYGKQYDFCTCIRLNDSINSIDMIAFSDNELTDFINRWDEIDQKCKNVILQANATPEQREKHRLKVKKCLNN